MKSIYRYSGYRPYLKDTFTSEKASSKSVTLASFAKAFGMSTAGLHMILSGKRNLTVDNTHRIARVLKMSEEERGYFEALVLRDQSLDAETKKHYSKRLKALGQNARVGKIRIPDKRFTTSWQLPALLVYLVDFAEFKKGQTLPAQELDRIAKKFSLSLDQLRSFLKLFKDAGFFELGPEDCTHFVLDRTTHQISQKDYVKNVAKKLIRKVDQDFDKADSVFRVFTLTMKTEDIPELKKDLILLFEKYMARATNMSKHSVIVNALTGIFPIYRN